MHPPDLIWQPGTVIERRGGRVRVRMRPVASCDRCARGQGCGAGVFSRLFARREVTLDLPDRLDIRAGTAVQVGVTTGALARAALAVYGLPLLAFLLAAWLAAYAGPPPGTPAGDLLSLCSGLVAGWITLRRTAPGLARFLSPVMREPPAACGSQTGAA